MAIRDEESRRIRCEGNKGTPSPASKEEKPWVIRLSKFVGRDQLPGDEIAFDRINRLFARARKVKLPVAKQSKTSKDLGNKTIGRRKAK